MIPVKFTGIGPFRGAIGAICDETGARAVIRRLVTATSARCRVSQSGKSKSGGGEVRLKQERGGISTLDQGSFGRGSVAVAATTTTWLHDLSAGAGLYQRVWHHKSAPGSGSGRAAAATAEAAAAAAAAAAATATAATAAAAAARQQ